MGNNNINSSFMADRRFTEMARVERELERRGIKRADFARQLGKLGQDLVNWRNRGIPKSKLLPVASALGWSVDYLLTGTEPHQRPNEYPFADFRTDLISDSGAINGRAVTEGAPADGYALVARYDIHASADDGSIVYQVIREDHGQAFRPDRLRERGMHSKDLMCIYATGDSMEPTLSDRDSILIDRSQALVRDGNIFVLRSGDEIKVKRLYKRPDGGIVIHSDNPRYPDIHVTSQDLNHIKIIGRVIWRGGEM